MVIVLELAKVTLGNRAQWDVQRGHYTSVVVIARVGSGRDFINR